MQALRRLLQRYLDLFVMEVRRRDGSTCLVSIDATGFGDCWLPIEISEQVEVDAPVIV